MSHALFNYTAGRQKRKQRKKKMAQTGSSGRPAPNVAKKMTSPETAQVSMTYVDAQRQNREASKKLKNSAKRFAVGLAIGLHAVAIIIGGIYFVRKTVLQKNEAALQSVLVDKTKLKPKRRTPPRAKRPPPKPKIVQVRTPKAQPITTSARIPMGKDRFTLPATDLPTGRLGTSNLERARGMFTQARQVKIVTTVPKFEAPKFETTVSMTKLDMGTNLTAVEFDMPDDIDMVSANLGEAKQSFSEFLKKVRERIKQVQRFPPSVRNLEPGAATTVRFTLFKDGTVEHPKVTVSSGSRVLDDAALAAVQNAVPYPSFPEGQSGNRLRLELPVVFELAN